MFVYYWLRFVLELKFLRICYVLKLWKQLILSYKLNVRAWNFLVYAAVKIYQRNKKNPLQFITWIGVLTIDHLNHCTLICIVFQLLDTHMCRRRSVGMCITYIKTTKIIQLGLKVGYDKLIWKILSFFFYCASEGYVFKNFVLNVGQTKETKLRGLATAL